MYADLGYRVLYVNHAADRREEGKDLDFGSVLTLPSQDGGDPEIQLITARAKDGGAVETYTIMTHSGGETSTFKSSGPSKSGISSHSSQFYAPSPLVEVKVVSELSEVEISGYNVIGVDEGHLFTDLYDTIKEWLKQKDLIVMVSGLDRSSEDEKIGQMLDLIPLSDDYRQFKAKCKECIQLGRSECHATRSKALVPKDKPIMVGGKNMYAATCKLHHTSAPSMRS